MVQGSFDIDKLTAIRSNLLAESFPAGNGPFMQECEYFRAEFEELRLLGKILKLYLVVFASIAAALFVGHTCKRVYATSTHAAQEGLVVVDL
jgi:hypothetical protein